MSEPIIWSPVPPDAVEHTSGERTLRVEQRAQPGHDGAMAWLGSVRKTGAALSAPLSFAWHDSRRDAMNWCWRQIAPDVTAGDLMHLVERHMAERGPR